MLNISLREHSRNVSFAAGIHDHHAHIQKHLGQKLLLILEQKKKVGVSEF